MEQEFDRIRISAYVFIALAGLLAGIAMGRLSVIFDAGRARTDLPSPPVPHPRSLLP
jgi:predicted Co/Zn/Cd cation transporter (cation efflux family)